MVEDGGGEGKQLAERLGVGNDWGSACLVSKRGEMLCGREVYGVC